MQVVTEEALFKRCKRLLKRTEDLYLHRCPEQSRWNRDLGRYYTTTEDNVVSLRGFESIEDLAEHCKALRPGERLAE